MDPMVAFDEAMQTHFLEVQDQLRDAISGSAPGIRHRHPPAVKAAMCNALELLTKQNELLQSLSKMVSVNIKEGVLPAWVIDQKIFFDRVSGLRNCNSCTVKDSCFYAPEPGETVRYNCPLWI